MKRDPKQFRERFNRWRSGEQVYSSGRPINKISDEQYANIMERVASENNPIWNEQRKKEGLPELSVDEDLLRILNDNSYDYRGYYNKYPNGTGNAIDHWTDEFKTVYHPTFSNESQYAPNNIHYVGKTQFNPKELKGGSWDKKGKFHPSLDQQLQWRKYDGGKSEDSPLVKQLYNNDANAWYMNDPYMRELALKDVVKKTIDSYPSPYQPPVVHYSSDIPTTRSKFNVYQDGYSDIILGTSTLKNDPNDYYNYKGNPLRTAAHEVAHYYDNLTERQFRTDDDSNSNFKFPEYNLDKLLDSPTELYSVQMHDMKPSERYADRIAAEIVPGYDRYENTKRKYNNGKTSLRIPKFDDGKPKYKTDQVQEIPEVTIIAKRKKEDPTAIIQNPLIKPGFDKNPFAMPTLEEFIQSNLRRYMPGMFSVGLKNINPLYKQLMYPKFDEGKPDDTNPDDIQTNIPEDLMESFYKDHPELQITPQNNPDYEGAFNMAKQWFTEAWLPNRQRYELENEYRDIDDEILYNGLNRYNRGDKQFIEYFNNFSIDPYLKKDKQFRKAYKVYMKQNPNSSGFEALRYLKDYKNRDFFKNNNLTYTNTINNLERDFYNFAMKSYYFDNAQDILKRRQAIRDDINSRYNNAFDILNKTVLYNPLDHQDDYINNEYIKNNPEVGAWIYNDKPDYRVYVNPLSTHNNDIWAYDGIASQMLHEMNHLVQPTFGIKHDGQFVKYGYKSHEIDSRIRQFQKYAQLDPEKRITREDLAKFKQQYGDDMFRIFYGGLDDDTLLDYLNNRGVNIKSTTEKAFNQFWNNGKSSLNIPKFQFGTNEYDPKKSLSEAIAIADKQEAEMKRRTGHRFNKDLGNKDLQVLSNGLHNNQTKFTEGIAKTAQILNQERSDAAKEEVRHYKNMANAVSTAAELASSYFMIAKGLRDLKLIRDWRILSDKAQTIMSGTGTAADFVQLNIADTPHEKLENAVELPFDVAGIIGGTNWARRTPLFGKYGDEIDTMLDIAGYGAALWDGVVKPTNWMINRMSRPIIKPESK